MTPEMILELERLVEKHERGHGQLTEAQADAMRHAITLSAISQSAENYRSMWLAQSARISALESDRDRHANTAEVWRKRVHEAADALADVLPGEVARLDLVARINELKRLRDGHAKELEARAVLAERRAERAERALRRAGFEDHGGEEWSPPVSTTATLVPPGWTARDEFAKAAMQGLLANDTRDGEFRNYAADAYAVADAMLKERGGAP